jgi:hypothetical protein
MPAIGSAAASQAAQALAACTGTAAGKQAAAAPAGGPGRFAANLVTLTSPKLALTGLVYDGVITVPTATGSIRALKFRLDRLQIAQLAPNVTTAPGTAWTVRGATTDAVLSGSVQFSVVSMTGKAFGTLPLTLTPDSPPPLTLPYLESPTPSRPPPTWPRIG